MGRGKRKEARSKNTFLSKSGGSSGTWNVDIALFYSWLCGKSKNKKYFRRAHSPHFLIPPSRFAFCTSSMRDSITNSKSYSIDVIGRIDPVTIASSICSKRHFLKNPHPRRERLTTKLMRKHLGYGVTLRK